ncbi:MAG TPA: DUF5818 domain-containing protein [Candidatus Angelobacter sp.]|nr:DUF5818 domain-containing protein [Candidatus Angelobacter sp.]
MRLRVLICLMSFFALALASTAQQPAQSTDQSQSSAQPAQAAGQSKSSAQPTAKTTGKSASGQRTVTGCVAREGEGFVLKTDEGTYEFDTARDLSPWVGKKVQLTGRWTATGVTTTAPVKNAAAESTQKTNDEKKAGTPKAFAGDLHLHINGVVVGDCEAK